MSEHYASRLLWVRANWRALSSLFFLLVSMSMSIVPSLQDFALTPLSAAIVSLVLMVWHLDEGSKALAGDTKIYPHGMQQAAPDIEACIRRSMQKTQHEHLHVRIIGCRLRDIRSVLMRITGGGIDQIKFDLFHIDPAYLEAVPWPRAKEEAATVRGSKEDIDILLSKFESRGVTLNFYSYAHPPIVYSYIIGDHTIFWGFFHWSDDLRTYVGPKNSCLRIQKGDRGFAEIKEWILNRCDQWSADAEQ